MVDLQALSRDLAAEHDELDDVLVSIGADEWDRPTPAPGWTIRDQISHLAFFDEQALLATTRPDRFTATLARITDLGALIDEPLAKGRSVPHEEVLEWWRNARWAMLSAFESVEPRARVPWFGPPMSLASFISARLMETWAHGQDVVDALGRARAASDRLKHVAHLGVRARRNSYAANGLEMPDGEVRVELTGPGGVGWKWNDDGIDLVSGDAMDFCLVVTQRRHLDDTDLVVQGPLATEWMSIAQAFAGPPGPGREPGQFHKASS